MTIEEKIRSFIVDNFLFGEESWLRNDGSFLEGGIIDSTGIMQLVAFVEQEFAIAVEDQELIPENLDSIDKVAAFVAKKGR